MRHVIGETPYTGRMTNLDFGWKVRSRKLEGVYPPCQYYSSTVTLTAWPRARGRQCWFGLTPEYSALHSSEHGRGPAHREGWSGGKWRYHHPPSPPPVKHEQRPGGDIGERRTRPLRHLFNIFLFPSHGWFRKLKYESKRPAVGLRLAHAALEIIWPKRYFHTLSYAI